MGLFDLDYDHLNDPLNLKKNAKKGKFPKTDAERRRSSLTGAMKEKIKDAVGNKCEVSRCDHKTYEIHHIIPIRKGGTNIGSNLVAICRNCHGDIKDGLLTQAKMKKIVRNRSKKVKQQITNILRNRQKVAKKEEKTKKGNTIGDFIRDYDHKFDTLLR